VPSNIWQALGSGGGGIELTNSKKIEHAVLVRKTTVKYNTGNLTNGRVVGVTPRLTSV
jgi:hypothetical protein